MFPELTILSHLFQILHTDAGAPSRPRGGYSTETVVITACCSPPIGAVAVIASKV